MAFIQIIECHTDRYEELKELEERWLSATEGKRTLQRSIVTRDREDPNHLYILAFFESYESAMKNSKLPETDEFGQKQQALLTEPAAFYNLDVVEDRDVVTAS